MNNKSPSSTRSMPAIATVRMHAHTHNHRHSRPRPKRFSAVDEWPTNQNGHQDDAASSSSFALAADDADMYDDAEAGFGAALV